MSEIPLHSFRRSRKQRSDYLPLSTSQEDDEDDNSDGTNHSQTSNSMPSLTARAAVASASANRNQEARWKGKRRQRYADDPEEQVNLLGDHEEDEHNHDIVAETASQVRASVHSIDLG